MTSVALLEFRFADAVPRALEKDGKKMAGRLINVSMFWRSTLFVTNFPRHMDDAAMRQMFGQASDPMNHTDYLVWDDSG
jgi:hypothetical protein